MPEYAYTAIDPKGREKTGRLAAASDDAARAKLTERNFYVVKVEAAQDGKSKQGKESAGCSDSAESTRWIRPILRLRLPPPQHGNCARSQRRRLQPGPVLSCV